MNTVIVRLDREVANDQQVLRISSINASAAMPTFPAAKVSSATIDFVCRRVKWTECNTDTSWMQRSATAVFGVGISGWV